MQSRMNEGNRKRGKKKEKEEEEIRAGTREQEQ